MDKRKLRRWLQNTSYAFATATDTYKGTRYAFTEEDLINRLGAFYKEAKLRQKHPNFPSKK